MEVYRRSQYFDEYIVPGSESMGYLESVHSANEYDEMTRACLSRYCSGGRLLDVGCAGGRFLALVEQAGYEGYGLEPNAQMAAHARETLGLKVVEGTLQDARERFGPSFFEIIHLADVLEHLWDLHGAFEEISYLLKGGGLLILQQPMTYHWTLFNLFLRLNMLMKKNRYSVFPPLHLWEFTPSSLRDVLSQKGFQVLHFRTFESKPKPIFIYSDPSVKKRIAFSVKALSCAISNFRISSFLYFQNSLASYHGLVVG